MPSRRGARDAGHTHDEADERRRRGDRGLPADIDERATPLDSPEPRRRDGGLRSPRNRRHRLDVELDAQLGGTTGAADGGSTVLPPPAARIRSRHRQPARPATWSEELHGGPRSPGGRQRLVDALRKAHNTYMDSAAIIKRLRRDGWQLVRVNGSHHHFRRGPGDGLVTVKHPLRDLPVGTLRNIYRQAGWRWSDKKGS